MKKLILLTFSYPYKPDDIFLEAEQRYFPADVPIDAIPFGYGADKTTLAEGIPENVSFLPLVWKRLSPLTHARYMIRALLRKAVRQDLRSFKIEKNAGFKTLAKSLSWISYGEYLFSKVEKHYRRELSEYPEQLVFYSFWLLTSAYAAARLREKYGCHAVARGNGGDIFEERSDLGRLPMRRYTLNNLDFVSVCSKDGQLYLIEKYHTGNICQAYLGCEDHGVRDAAPPSEDEPFVIASCGYVIPLKRIGLIAEALGLTGGKRIEWVHFGDGPLYSELEKKASALPRNITVKLMGRVSHDDLMTYYSRHDIHLFISASTTETTPVSIMEALSFGIPVLATDAGGSRETISPEHGVLLPLDISAADLAEGIRVFTGMPADKYLSMRKAARRFWEENFSASKNYEEFYKRLREL